MSKFYSDDEFSYQVDELVQSGYSIEAATAIVEVREASDGAEYDDWRRECARDDAFDHLERDCDEAYEPDSCLDADYENQYDFND
jgi:hypothetical protein